MSGQISPRLLAIVDALPLSPGMRVLEIGCGPGAAAREVARRIGGGQIVAIDRSRKAIGQALVSCHDEIASGALSLRHVSIEDFELAVGEPLFDFAFAVRVGALDGRHPAAGERALARIAAVLKPQARMFIDGGDPLRELVIPR